MEKNNPKIECPKCGELISIDDVLTHQIENRIKKEIEVSQRAKEAEIASQKEELSKKEKQLLEAQKSVEIEINKKATERIATEKILLWKKAIAEADKNKAGEVKLLEEQLLEKETKLKEANEKELEIRREKNRLEEEKKNFELDKQRQFDEERKKIEEDAAKKASEAEHYKIAQLEKKLSDALKVNEEQKRKLEQGSQQSQGEVLELELEELLKREFPEDEILEISKGVNGTDIIQKVNNRLGRGCGQIAWEFKKTKAWSEGWIQKLKDDQRRVKAELAVIASATLPADVKGFACRDGVWICDIKLVLALAGVLRTSLKSVARERAISVGKNEKMEVLWTYLTGVEFNQKVEAIIEAFVAMEDGLKKEKLAYEKIWSEREKQIQKVLINTTRMYGDLSGLAPLPQIKRLEIGESER